MTATQATGAIEAPLLDEETIAELRLLFGERTAAVLGKTRAILAERAAQIGPAADVGAWASVGRIAHEMAGMDAQIGLSRLAAEALRLERSCERPEGGGPTAGVATLTALVAASLAALPAA